MSWVFLALLVVGLQTHEPTLGDALALQRQAEALACSIQDDACLGEEFRLRGAADQAVRRSDPAALGCTASDLACLAAAWLRIDKPNQSRLTAVMEARGWPPLAGEAAVGAPGQIVTGNHSFLLADPGALDEVMANLLSVGGPTGVVPALELDDPAGAAAPVWPGAVL